MGMHRPVSAASTIITCSLRWTSGIAVSFHGLHVPQQQVLSILMRLSLMMTGRPLDAWRWPAKVRASRRQLRFLLAPARASASAHPRQNLPPFHPAPQCRRRRRFLRVWQKARRFLLLPASVPRHPNRLRSAPRPQFRHQPQSLRPFLRRLQSRHRPAKVQASHRPPRSVPAHRNRLRSARRRLSRPLPAKVRVFRPRPRFRRQRPSRLQFLRRLLFHRLRQSLHQFRHRPAFRRQPARALPSLHRRRFHPAPRRVPVSARRLQFHRARPSRHRRFSRHPFRPARRNRPAFLRRPV